MTMISAGHVACMGGNRSAYTEDLDINRRIILKNLREILR
jgi:hypothetical protein